MSFVGEGGFLQGRAVNRPPLFCGENFSQWKCLMKMFIIDQDMELWKIISTGPLEDPTKTEGEDAPKPYDKLSALEQEKISKNYRAINLLYCALNADEFNRI